MPLKRVLQIVVCLATSLFAVAALAAGDPKTAAAADALDYAFRFAAAIHADPRDRSAAEANVVSDLIEAGRFDRAMTLADQVTLWRRGTVYADLATALAKSGRREAAAPWLERAVSFRGTIDGWQGVRIESHIAQAEAALGNVERAREISKRLAAADRQYQGRDAATVASALATQGKPEEAFAEVKAIDAAEDLQQAWWRSAGMIALARDPKLPKEKRLAALHEAQTSADKIAGWKRIEALGAIAIEYAVLDQNGEAVTVLEQAQALAGGLRDAETAKPAILANLARNWSKIGRSQRAGALLEQAETLVTEIPELERPAILANIGGSWFAAGEPARAHGLYDRAFGAAESLVNARPRALAVVQILRSHAKNDLPLADPTKQRVERLLAGLKDPW